MDIVLSKFPHLDLSFLSDDISDSDAVLAELNSKSIFDPEYSLAGGLFIVNEIRSHEQFPASFSASVAVSHCNAAFKAFVNANKDELDAMVNHKFDESHNIMAMKTFMKGYLMRRDGVTIETPSYLYLRVATRIHMPHIDKIRELYIAFCNKELTAASPSLFNAGNTDQLASCFLQDMRDDSISGIFKSLMDTANISKEGGGVSLSVSKIRSCDSLIKSTGGKSTGIPQMLRLWNETSKYVTQGGRRPGSAAIYFELHHPDVLEILELKLPDGPEDLRCRQLFFGAMLTSTFLNAVRLDTDWHLFDPTTATGHALNNTYGDEYTSVYEAGVKKEEYSNVVPARDVFAAIVKSLMLSGTPYLLNKDEINRASNVGYVRQSNLCCEIVEATSPEETGVCTLTSVNLNACIVNGSFDFKKLGRITKLAVRNLERTIDINVSPTPECKVSNDKFRNIGIGVQGLADVFSRLNLAWGDPAALELDAKIFEMMYLAANEQSVKLAAEFGSYSEYENTPLSEGKLHFDFYEGTKLHFPERWEALRSDLGKYGRRHALLIALMPTASTSTLLGCNSESFEPRSAMLYVRRLLSGEFFCISNAFVDRLKRDGLWNEQVALDLVKSKGSVVNMTTVSDDIKRVFQNAFEVPLKVQLAHAAARNPFVDQSSSFNCHMRDPSTKKIASYIFHAFFKTRAKTVSYYHRAQMKSHAMGTMQKERAIERAAEAEEKEGVRATDTEACEMCSA